MIDVESILKNQDAYFNSGKTRDIRFRLEQLRKFRHAILQHEDDIYDALQADFHKPRFETYTTEIGVTIKEINLFLKKLPRWQKPQAVGTPLGYLPARSRIYYQPYGRVLIIGTWNYPLQLTLLPLVGAIGAGNCAVVKPSERAVHTSALVAEIIRNTFDPAFVTCVEGGIPETQALLEQKFHFIFFTGGQQVGKIVMKAAAEHLTPVTLELGGKCPAIIDRDASLPYAVRRVAWAKFLNGGQTCVAPDYVLVHRSLKADFIALMEKTLQRFYGKIHPDHGDLNYLIDERHFNRLLNLMKQSKVIIGGENDPDKCFIGPTVLDEVDWEDAVMQEEIFGPLLPVLEFDDLEAIADKIDSEPSPLALYYFGKNSSEQRKTVERIRFGGGATNECIMHLVNSNLPFGGIGSSGMGSYHGRTSFELFSHKKSMLHKVGWPEIPLLYPPYNEKHRIWISRLMPFL